MTCYVFVAQQGHVVLAGSRAQCNHCSSQYVSVEKPVWRERLILPSLILLISMLFYFTGVFLLVFFFTPVSECTGVSQHPEVAVLMKCNNNFVHGVKIKKQKNNKKNFIPLPKASRQTEKHKNRILEL